MDRNKIDEIKQKADILDVISSYIKTYRVGNSKYRCVCPFHKDSDPSLYIYPNEGRFFCFGCKASGDAISFIQMYEGLDFKEACLLLADRYGVEYQDEHIQYQGDKGSVRIDKKRLYSANKLAAQIYYSELLKKENPYLQYLKKRNINRSSIDTFMLGAAYTPNIVLNSLLKQGFSKEELEVAGLVQYNRYGQLADVFNERLIYPIFDKRSNVIGFGARTLKTDKSVPKYLNTKETPIFKKREHLYAENLLKRDNYKEIIILEGYMDVISLYQRGILGVTATLGTSLQEYQVKLLNNNNTIICYDGDEAGLNAMESAIHTYYSAVNDINAINDLYVLIIPNKMDPDEYINKYGKESFYSLNKINSHEFLLSRIKNKYDLSKEEKLNAYFDEACTYIKELSGLSNSFILSLKDRLHMDTGKSVMDIEQNIKELKSSENDISYLLKKSDLDSKRLYKIDLEEDKYKDDQSQRWIFAACLKDRSLLKEIESSIFDSEFLAKAFDILKDLREDQDLLSNFEDVKDRAYLSGIMNEPVASNRDELQNTVMKAISMINEKRLKSKKDYLMEKIAKAIENGDMESFFKLSNEVKLLK